MLARSLRKATGGKGLVVISSGDFLVAREWDPRTGVGKPLAASPSVGAGSISDVKFTPAGDGLVMSLFAASHGDPPIAAIAWTGSAFGPTFDFPSGSFHGQLFNDVAIPPDGGAVLTESGDPSGTPTRPLAVKLTPSGFGTRYTSVPAFSPSTFESMDMHPDGSAVLFGNRTSPYLAAYGWSPAGFGAKLSSPTLSGRVRILQFSADGSAFIAAIGGGGSSSDLRAYRWTSTGVGTAMNTPAIYDMDSIAFSPQGDAVAFALPSSPYLTVRRWSPSGIGSAFSAPSTPMPGRARTAKFTPDGDALVLTLRSYPYVVAYEWTSSGLGAALPDPPAPYLTGGVGLAFLGGN